METIVLYKIKCRNLFYRKRETITAHFARQGDESPFKPPSEEGESKIIILRGVRGGIPQASLIRIPFYLYPIENHHVYLGFELFHQIFVFRLKFRLEPFKVLLFG